ncbi:phosphohistidine phosphatase SixA [Pseudoalteromonas byunsanensis]|uniref:Phosphohistidine phosphatase SixA n=1 Tax=Pseudoalteromonas byunsanensis TaxID=327939 RepID=A0A1S1N355_9GAMM|nr:phosphohistidine phosphatase SixA [Pseudoalteromonas byunsanensis]OHU95529.1 phosphohistidine phosphatase SixA [Pseudoalteromonas byunsanensis]
MKTILIMRHGEAVPMQVNDEARPLTERGIKQAKEMAWWLKGHFKPQAALVSPYTRAQQTAQQVLAINDFSYVEICKDVTPAGNAAFAIDYLETLISLNEHLDVWLIVAHMPIVSYLVEQLCPGHLPIFNTAAIAVIEYDEVTQQGVFKSMNSPSL